MYIGVTSNIVNRTFEHKNKIVDGFSKKYNVHMFVHFESTNDINSALIREKQLKAWKREWKIRLIEKSNPDWKDLPTEFYQ